MRNASYHQNEVAHYVNCCKKQIRHKEYTTGEGLFRPLDKDLSLIQQHVTSFCCSKKVGLRRGHKYVFILYMIQRQLLV